MSKFALTFVLLFSVSALAAEAIPSEWLWDQSTGTVYAPLTHKASIFAEKSADQESLFGEGHWLNDPFQKLIWSPISKKLMKFDAAESFCQEATWFNRKWQIPSESEYLKAFNPKQNGTSLQNDFAAMILGLKRANWWAWAGVRMDYGNIFPLEVGTTGLSGQTGQIIPFKKTEAKLFTFCVSHGL